MSENVTQADIDRAAIQWCNEKDRETFLEDTIYFKANWRHLPGLRSRVEALAAHRRAAEIAAGENVRWACYDGFYEQLLEDYKSNDFLAGVQACLNFIRALDVAQIVGGEK